MPPALPPLGLAWVIPFAGILLSIALMPLLVPGFWHRHFGKVSLFWALAFLLPFAAVAGVGVTWHELAHTLLMEYVPFVVLLFALFVISGGIHVRGDLVATPALNTGVLALGTLLASLMGTTGAAMLLVRPLIRANAGRTHNAHVLVFFIFLVGNIGGSLTPIGDPPLFLGFLKGVDFFWPARALWAPMLLLSVVLLAIFWLLDTWLHRRSRVVATPAPPTPPMPPVPRTPIAIDGGINFLLLAAAVAAVLASGLWKPGLAFEVMGTTLESQNLARDAILLALAALSWKLSSASVREANAYTWAPIAEVAKLFAGIFVTIIPAIAILRAGREGALAPLVALVSGPDGRPDDAMYFWMTGLLSSLLDNAPTYLVFFNLAGGDPAQLMGEWSRTLMAISCGAVFMGANTYIGNAPNFMVKAIAEERGIRMPGFFGYLLWSSLVLLPLFALITMLFFRG